MKVYDEEIQVKPKEDGTFTISIRLNDETLVVKTISKQAAVNLLHRLQELLKD